MSHARERRKDRPNANPEIHPVFAILIGVIAFIFAKITDLMGFDAEAGPFRETGATDDGPKSSSSPD